MWFFLIDYYCFYSNHFILFFQFWKSIFFFIFYFRYLDISRHQAEDILRNETVPNNTFLVRKQGKNEGHAISIK